LLIPVVRIVVIVNVGREGRKVRQRRFKGDRLKITNVNITKEIV